jgi:5-methylcytosine-specific restriction endonuclease McrA
VTQLELERLGDYSDAALLAEVRRIAGLVDGPVYHAKLFKAHARVSYALVWQRFGGWYAALERAGLEHLRGPRTASHWPRRRGPARRLTDKELLDDLRRIARAKGSDTIRASDLARFGGRGDGVYARRFGSWRDAVARAGLKPGKWSCRYSNTQCIHNLRRVWAHYGRQPRAVEMGLPPSTIGVAPYQKRWGGWRRALKAFVDRVNAERDDPLGPLVRPWVGRAVPRPPPAPEQQRTAPTELRYAVLTRDRFRCALCGDSPAIDPACRLEIDHIRPYSLGGKTVASNLRTLCRRCNIGRGNRAAAAEAA